MLGQSWPICKVRTELPSTEQKVKAGVVKGHAWSGFEFQSFDCEHVRKQLCCHPFYVTPDFFRTSPMTQPWWAVWVGGSTDTQWQISSPGVTWTTWGWTSPGTKKCSLILGGGPNLIPSPFGETEVDGTRHFKINRTGSECGEASTGSACRQKPGSRVLQRLERVQGFLIQASKDCYHNPVMMQYNVSGFVF